MAGRSLKNIISELEKFAPLYYAESWDNVGLLIEPYNRRNIENIMLTNDLTENVLEEALKKKINMIISYHPPIFAPLKRITLSNWKERIVATCLAESIAVYSPHTAWDAVAGGVNDWLVSAFPAKDIKPIQTNEKLPEDAGAGRIFSTDISLSQAIRAIQKHINLDVQVAVALSHTLETPIKTIALCAGSGGSLLKGVKADLYVTGEMSHHEILDANHRDISVICCNHSNSERGFLVNFKEKLSQMLAFDCEVHVSEEDKDPLKVFAKTSN